MIDFSPYDGKLVYLRVKGDTKDIEGKLEFKKNQGQGTIVLKASKLIDGENNPR